MALGILTLKLHIPSCASLKEKRSRIRPFLTRLQREFNVSSAELDLQDVWQNSLVGCAYLSSDARQTERTLQQIVNWTESHWPQLSIEEQQIELL